MRREFLIRNLRDWRRIQLSDEGPQAFGLTNAPLALVKTEQERGPDFPRLANALSALYPQSCNEKRLLDAMLLAVPRGDGIGRKS